MDTSSQEATGSPCTSIELDMDGISIATDYHQSYLSISNDSAEIANSFATALRNFRVLNHNFADIIVLCFFISCLQASVFVALEAYFQIICQATIK